MPVDEPALIAALIAANRAAVFGGIAREILHDLRSPLQMLAMAAQTIAGSPSAPPDPLDVELLDSGTRTLSGDLDLLGALTRPAPSPAAIEPVVLGEVIAFVETLARRQHGLPDVGVEVRYPASTPAAAGHPDHLGHALLNLVTNAKEAMRRPPRGVITITAMTSDGWVDVVVEDEGTGVAPDIADRLFEPFVTTKAPGHGAGLGLFAARAIAATGGGTVLWQAERPDRTCFTLRLPVWHAAGRPQASG